VTEFQKHPKMREAFGIYSVDLQRKRVNHIMRVLDFARLQGSSALSIGVSGDAHLAEIEA
jgi:hypothetical protein